MVIITDASSDGGGGGIFQWQDGPEVKKASVNQEGHLQTDPPMSSALVPLGFFSWKHSGARRNYSVYEWELLAGVLLISSQRNILNPPPPKKYPPPNKNPPQKIPEY